MSVDDAVELGVRSIYHATHRDTGSGGVVRGKYYNSIYNSLSCS